MEAAKGDPLRAQEIEQNLCGLWFHRYIAWREQEQTLQEREQGKLDTAEKEAKRRR